MTAGAFRDPHLDAVFDYHDATKHHPHRYARGPGHLDWATQPDPFRRFVGAPFAPLLVGGTAFDRSYDGLYTNDETDSRTVSLETLSAFLECSLAISAWKSYRGATWALRCNPSSGNLHPTEGYLVAGPIDGVGDSPGVYHYAVKDHGLERRCAFEPAGWAKFARSWGSSAFIIGLSSVYWREAWKYGERAFRYCQHDVGHALACVRIAAALLGWQVTILHRLSDAQVAALLGLDRGDDFRDAEPEHPDLAAVVHDGGRHVDDRSSLDSDFMAAVAAGNWTGRANRLSAGHVHWEAIQTVAEATAKPRTPEAAVADGTLRRDAPPPTSGDADRHNDPGARRVVLRRRSATGMDARSSLMRSDFYKMLIRVMPGPAVVPWDAWPWAPCIHLGLFVHRVESLVPGLYVLVRDAAAIATVRAAMQDDFAWTRPPGRPEGLPLYLLREADCRQAAAQLSLGQAIAGDGAFSLGMIADFDRTIERSGPWSYRRLFWEAGMLGQVLYLEAEVVAIRSGKPWRATGIGAYFDDAVHDAFGLRDRHFQSLYHFTVGAAVDDDRLTTEPPYPPDIVKRRSAARGGGVHLRAL